MIRCWRPDAQSKSSYALHASPREPAPGAGISTRGLRMISCTTGCPLYRMKALLLTLVAHPWSSSRAPSSMNDRISALSPGSTFRLTPPLMHRAHMYIVSLQTLWRVRRRGLLAFAHHVGVQHLVQKAIQPTGQPDTQLLPALITQWRGELARRGSRLGDRLFCSIRSFLDAAWQCIEAPEFAHELGRQRVPQVWHIPPAPGLHHFFLPIETTGPR